MANGRNDVKGFVNISLIVGVVALVLLIVGIVTDMTVITFIGGACLVLTGFLFLLVLLVGGFN
ncbi:MAG TPA: hypothetical protein QF753_03370 [Victivallales bacterium]|nr:hypothetical protein [Victivallales bacterium]